MQTLMTAALLAGGLAAAGMTPMAGAQMSADQTTGASSDVDQLRSEREEFVKEIRRVENLNKKYSEQIQDVKEAMDKQQQDFTERVNQLEEKLSKQQTTQEVRKKEENPSQAISPAMEEATYNILSRGSQLNPNDESFRDELAKAHYNMGNIFFQRGEYQRAVVEYYQSVDLSPYDPDTHYNLAFVSGEYLKDQDTALKHYQWYLYLRPDAGDKDLVKEKMLSAKLAIRGRINSPLDKERGFEDVVR
jgi:tetratricopeptide (TPR) repeat protein